MIADSLTQRHEELRGKAQPTSRVNLPGWRREPMIRDAGR